MKLKLNTLSFSNPEVDFSLYNNVWYKKELGAGKIKQLAWYFCNIIFCINPLNPSGYLKIKVLQLFGAKIGKGVIIKQNVNIKYPWKLSIGNHSWIGERVWIDNLDFVEIGNNVCISQGAMLLTGNHDYKKTSFDLMTRKITIRNGVWIGAMTTVCPGVTCYSHSVLTVGSIATKDLKEYTIYQGNPALAVKQRCITDQN